MVLAVATALLHAAHREPHLFTYAVVLVGVGLVAAGVWQLATAEEREPVEPAEDGSET